MKARNIRGSPSPGGEARESVDRREDLDVDLRDEEDGSDRERNGDEGDEPEDPFPRSEEEDRAEEETEDLRKERSTRREKISG